MWWCLLEGGNSSSVIVGKLRVDGQTVMIVGKLRVDWSDRNDCW